MRLSPTPVAPLTTARLRVPAACAGEGLAEAVEQALAAGGFCALARQARSQIAPLNDHRLAQAAARDYLRLSVSAPPPLQDPQGPAMRILAPDHVVLRSALTGGSRRMRTPALAAGEALITRAQMRPFAAEAGEERLAEELQAAGGSDEPERPAAGMTFAEARRYCHWLSARCGRTYRLPFEWEWARLLAEGESVFASLHGPLWQWTQSAWSPDVCTQRPMERLSTATLVGGQAEPIWGAEASAQPPYRRCEAPFLSEPNTWIGLRVFAEISEDEAARSEAGDA